MKRLHKGKHMHKSESFPGPPLGSSSPQAPVPPLESERTIGRVLPRFQNSFDLFAGHQVVLLWLINTAGAATGGPVSLLYWFIGGLGFYVPTLVATAQLALLYPGEGSLYLWTYRAFAAGTRRLQTSFFLSFLVGACFWIIGPLALVIGANAFVSFLQGVMPLSWQNAYLAQPWQQGLVMIGIVLVCQLVLCQRSMRIQHLITYAFITNLLACALLVLAGVVWLAQGHASATNFGDLASWQPTGQTYGLFGLICLGYLGAPTAMTLGGELRERVPYRRAVLHHLFWGGLLVLVCYHLATWALLVVAGQKTLASASNLNFTLIQIVSQVLGRPAAVCISLFLMSFVLISPLVYCLASSRLLVMGSLDGRLPLALGRTSRRHVPVRAFWMQTLFAIGMLALIFLVAPLVTSLGQPATLATIVYSVVLAALTLIFMLATLALFVNLFLACRYAKEQVARQRVLPLPLVWGCLFVGSVTCLLVMYDTIRYSFIPQIVPNATWSLVVSLCLGFCIVLLMVFSVLASGEAASQRLIRLYAQAGAREHPLS